MTSAHFAKLAAALALIANSTFASAQSLEQCVPAAEGLHFTVTAPGKSRPVAAVAMGRGTSAVVLSNTAYNAPCEWLPVARELVQKGYQAVLWRYEDGDLTQIADLKAIVTHLQGRGAVKIALVGGSRGGCLSMMTASELGPGSPIAGVAILSCAAVFNRRSPTATGAWAAKLGVPLLHMTGENDPIPTLREAREEFAAFPGDDKHLIVVPGTSAHGDQLLTDPSAAQVARPALLQFLGRVLLP